MSTRYFDNVTGASTGFSTAANWSADTAPIDADTAVIGVGAAQIDSSLDLSAIQPTLMTISSDFTGWLGSASAAAQIGPVTFVYGTPSTGTTTPSYSGRIYVNFGTDPVAATVLGTKSSSIDSGLEPVRFLGSNAGNVFNILGGIVGIATTLPTETATVATLNVDGNATVVNLGAGVTLTTVNQANGTVSVGSAATTVTVQGGTFRTRAGGDYTLTTVNIYGATVQLDHVKSAGNIVTTLNLYDGAVLDVSANPNAINVGTINVNGAARIIQFKGKPSQFTWTTLNRNGGSLSLE